jgi:putative peptide zinc metalloprotease protein
MQLPTAALGTSGGGRILVDPTAQDTVTTFNRVFEVDVALPESIEPQWLGQRMKVRFDHGTRPLASQVYRELRQIFLTRFGV